MEIIVPGNAWKARKFWGVKFELSLAKKKRPNRNFVELLCYQIVFSVLKSKQVCHNYVKIPIV